jgi:hypothetical protein
MEKIDRLEMIVNRLMRRASKRSVALITPYPISSASFGDDIKGSILRYMFPCDGIITKGFVRLGTKPKEGVSIEVKMSNDAGSVVKGFTLDKRLLGIDPDLKVIAGDCLDISVISGTDPVKEIWVSFLWKPTVSDVEAKSYLIADLEKVIEEFTE